MSFIFFDPAAKFLEVGTFQHQEPEHLEYMQGINFVPTPSQL